MEKTGIAKHLFELAHSLMYSDSDKVITSAHISKLLGTTLSEAQLEKILALPQVVISNITDAGTLKLFIANAIVKSKQAQGSLQSFRSEQVHQGKQAYGIYI